MPDDRPFPPPEELPGRHVSLARETPPAALIPLIQVGRPGLKISDSVGAHPRKTRLFCFRIMLPSTCGYPNCSRPLGRTASDNLRAAAVCFWDGGVSAPVAVVPRFERRPDHLEQVLHSVISLHRNVHTLRRSRNSFTRRANRTRQGRARIGCRNREDAHCPLFVEPRLACSRGADRGSTFHRHGVRPHEG